LFALNQLFTFSNSVFTLLTN